MGGGGGGGVVHLNFGLFTESVPPLDASLDVAEVPLNPGLGLSLHIAANGSSGRAFGRESSSE
eukprot:10772750-Karenia_brevis.AAC.1